jgi:hypothetical protein
VTGFLGNIPQWLDWRARRREKRAHLEVVETRACAHDGTLHVQLRNDGPAVATGLHDFKTEIGGREYLNPGRIERLEVDTPTWIRFDAVPGAELLVDPHPRVQVRLTLTDGRGRRSVVARSERRTPQAG